MGYKIDRSFDPEDVKKGIYPVRLNEEERDLVSAYSEMRENNLTYAVVRFKEGEVEIRYNKIKPCPPKVG